MQSLLARRDRTLLKMRLVHVFLLLASLAWISCVAGNEHVVVAVGNTAFLYCGTSILDELLEVRWMRSKDANYSIINHFRGGRDQQRCELPEYVGRTELVKEGLARGSVSLKLFNVSVADEGVYRCHLQTKKRHSIKDFHLNTTALGSNPRIDIEGFEDGGLKLVCRSAGWYPKPTLVNKDGGELEIRQEENGFYNIKYFRIVMENSSRTFSCRIRNPITNQEQEVPVNVADALFRKSSGSAQTPDFTTFLIVNFIIGGVTAVLLLIQCSWIFLTNKQGVSSAVHTGLCYLKVPLDQGLRYANQQSPVCAVKNNGGSEPVLQSQDTIEQSQASAVKKITEGSPPVPQSQDTIEQSQVSAVKETTKGSPPVLQSQDTIEQLQVSAMKNNEGSACDEKV